MFPLPVDNSSALSPNPELSHPVSLFRNAFNPLAVFFCPVVLNCSALLPRPVLELPVERLRASAPTAVDPLALTFAPRAPAPTPVLAAPVVFASNAAFPTAVLIVPVLLTSAPMPRAVITGSVMPVSAPPACRAVTSPCRVPTSPCKMEISVVFVFTSVVTNPMLVVLVPMLPVFPAMARLFTPIAVVLVPTSPATDPSWPLLSMTTVSVAPAGVTLWIPMMVALVCEPPPIRIAPDSDATPGFWIYTLLSPPVKAEPALAPNAVFPLPVDSCNALVPNPELEPPATLFRNAFNPLAVFA